MLHFKNLRLWRLYLLGAIPLLLLALSIKTLWTLQIGREGQRLREEARKQYFSEITLPAQRGVIYDRKGRPLTINVEKVEVYQHGKLDNEMLKTLRRYGLSPVKDFRHPTKIGYISPEFTDSINNINQKYSKKHPAKKKNYVLSMHEYWTRYTVMEEGYSSLIGYVGKDQYGLLGIEKVLNDYLKGIDGKLPCIKSAGKTKKFFTLDRERIDPVQGKPLQLTIDAYIQEIAYAALKEKVDELSAKGGFVIITNPENGEILSMVSYPLRNNENFVLAYPYEPGSTFKIVVYSGALDSGIITPFDSIDTEDGKLVVENRTIRDVHKMGKITWLEAFSHSSNVAAAKLALKMGKKRMYEQILKLGFGSPTGSFLKGQCKPPGNYKKWKESKLATLGIGYGLLVNGLQMAMAYGAIANGGYLYSPKIILQKDPVKVRKALGEKSVKYLKFFMREVVENGTGKKARLPGIAVCGKTGTAMVYDNEKHYYDPKRKVTSFIGFFPCEDPKYLIYVVIFEPKGIPWLMYGGEVAAPVFRKIAENLVWSKIHENI